MKFLTAIVTIFVSLLPVVAIAATPDSNSAVKKTSSGFAEKGKPIHDRSSASCLSITKTSSVKNEVGDRSSTGRGQIPPACLPKPK